MSEAAPPAARADASIRHPDTRALLVVTFTTGLVDAVSCLGLGHVYTANMTGDIVLLGFGTAGSGGLPIMSPLVSLVAFLLGAGSGGLLAKRLPSGTPSTARARSRSRSRSWPSLGWPPPPSASRRTRVGRHDRRAARVRNECARNATARKLAVSDLTPPC